MQSRPLPARTYSVARRRNGRNGGRKLKGRNNETVFFKNFETVDSEFQRDKNQQQQKKKKKKTKQKRKKKRLKRSFMYHRVALFFVRNEWSRYRRKNGKTCQKFALAFLCNRHLRRPNSSDSAPHNGKRLSSGQYLFESNLTHDMAVKTAGMWFR